MAIFYRTRYTPVQVQSQSFMAYFLLLNKFNSEYPKLSDTNILKSTWDVLESRVQSVYILPISLCYIYIYHFCNSIDGNNQIKDMNR